MAIWLRADGRRETVTPADGVAFTADELRAYVGGEVHVVAAPADLDGRPCYFVLDATRWAHATDRRDPRAWPINWDATVGWHLVGGDPHAVLIGEILVVRRSELGINDDARD